MATQALMSAADARPTPCPHPSRTRCLRLLRWLGVAFAATILWILGNVLVGPHYSFAQPSRLPGLFLAALTLAGIGLLAPRLAGLAERLEAHPRARRLVRLVLLALIPLALALTMVLAYAVAMRSGFDAGVIDRMARMRATGAVLPEHYLAYNGHFPNNLFLLAGLSAWYHAWPGAYWDEAHAMLNPVSLVAALALTYLTARRVAGALAGYLVLLPGSALLLLSPWLGVVYSDAQGAVYPIAIAYLYLRQADASGPGARAARAAWWAAIGVVAGFGIALKPTVIFALGAAVIVAVLTWRARRWRDAAAGVSLLLALPCSLGLLAAGTMTGLLEEEVGVTPVGQYADQRFPPTHHLMTGAQVDGTGPYRQYGDWEAGDVAYTESLPPGPARFWGPVGVYRERVAAMGAVGYATFLNDKATWIFSDSTFYSCCEGAMAQEPTPFAHHGRASVVLQQFLGRYGAHYALTWTMWHTAWLVTLALCCVPLLGRGRVLRPDGQAVLQLGLIGLLLFLLFFEGRSRFLYLYLPYFLVLAASGAAVIAHRRGRTTPPGRPAEVDQLSERRPAVPRSAPC